MTQGARDWASMGRGLEGRRQQETEPALDPSGDAQGAGPGSARAGGEEAEPGCRPSLRPVSVMTHGPGAGPKRVARGPGGGAWPSPETLDQVVVRRGFRRPQCVRRTARGQSGRTEQSKPETASSRSVWSQDAEHPGSRLQHVSTAPTPCAPCPPSLSPALLSVPRVRASACAAPRALLVSVVPSQSMPNHTHPESSSRSPSPPQQHGLPPTGREGKTEAPEGQCLPSLRTQGPRPQ